MTFPFTCSACGHVNSFGWSQVGQQINCAGCEKPMMVPVPREVVGPVVPAPTTFRFRCPACRRKFSIKRELAGKKIRCTGCGAGVRVPLTEDQPATLTGRGARTTDPTTAGHSGSTSAPAARIDKRAEAEPAEKPPSPLLDDLGWIETARRPRRRRRVLPSRSEHMEKVREEVAENEAADAQAKLLGAKKRMKRKKKKGYFDAKETLQLVAGVGALVALLAFLAWGYPEFRFPLGGSLCVIGFIVYLLGSAALRQIVAEEGFLKLMFYRFCPPYQWWYVMTHWEETRDFFAFFVAGSVIMAIGGGIIKTSAEGKRAEASDRAYRKMQEPKPVQSPPAFLKGTRRDGD
jgi:DNA-directed RNA polymerase subunit RPC12/RpoP